MKQIAINISLVILLVVSFNQLAVGQRCLRTIFERSGTVYHLASAYMQFDATSNKVEIRLKKTGGVANGYLDIMYTRNNTNNLVTERIVFAFDEANGTKSIFIDGVKDQKVNMNLVNNANVSRTISYEVKVKGRTDILHIPTPRKSVLTTIGESIYMAYKAVRLNFDYDSTATYYALPSCTGRAKVVVSSNGSGNVTVYEENGQLSNGRTNWSILDTGRYDGSQNLEYDEILFSDRMLKIQIITDFGSASGCTLDARATNESGAVILKKGPKLEKSNSK